MEKAYTPPVRPKNEESRLKSLYSLDVLDSGPEPEFDSLVKIAALVCDAPVSLISLVDSQRQWFKACVGMPGVSETSRDIAFCAHAILGDGIFEVPNALEDERFASNPLVANQPEIRFYAGAPIRLSDGANVGTVCVIDSKPRQLSTMQREVLSQLAVAVSRALEGRRSQRELARQQDERQNMYESTPAMLYSVKPDGNLANVNAAFARRLGYSSKEMVGVGLCTFMSPASGKFFVEVGLPRLLTQGSVAKVSYQFLTRHGDTVDTQVSAVLQRDSVGLPIYSLSTVEDVTQQLQTERELKEERRHLENLVKGTNAGTWELDLLTGEDKINEIYAQMLGYDVPAMVAKIAGRFQNIVHPDDRELVEVNWASHISGRTEAYEAEFRVQHCGGHWVWILSRGRVGDRDANGLALNISGIHLDVSERRNAIDLANRALHDLQKTLDALPSMVGYWDQNLNNRFANSAYAAWFGVDQNLIPGMHVSQLLGADLYALNLPRLVAALQGVEQTFERDIPVPGSTDVNHTVARYMPDFVDGRVQGIYVLVVDVTEIKRGQIQLKELNLQLQERTRQAEAANAGKSAFLANMSHEIRTPMNAVLGMLQLLQGTELTSRQFDYASKAEDAAKGLLELLNDILDFSKVEAGKMILETAPFRLDRLLRDLSVVLSANSGSKEVEVLFDVDPTLPEVLMGDFTRLKQVLINLGGNAIKFTSQGEVLISLRNTATNDSGVTIEFAVKDSGIGIAPENHLHIFSGFSQAEASTTRRFGGTGLGLAICKRLISLMGGDIQLISEEGVGSTFLFTLTMPFAAEGPAESVLSTSAALVSHQVLVVDDNPIARELTAKMVRALGWSAVLSESGQNALERIWSSLSKGEACPYSLVLMDWQMPGMDGWETTRHLREMSGQSTGPDPVVIMLTAHGRDNIGQRSIQEQEMLNGFLVKPITASMLFEEVVTASTDRSTMRKAAKGRSSMRRLAGIRILVVEDNLINQQVADELLTAEGAIVSLAANGQIAVDAVTAAAPQFDIVLMDIQMPVLDGYAATRLIREELKLRDLPIIAMSANVMASDREACITAGMNDHIGKPFDMGKLISLIIRSGGHQPEDPDWGVAHPITDQDFDLDEIPGLDLRVALGRMSGMRSLYIRTARDFIRILTGCIPELQQKLVSGDKQQVLMQLHTLKGNAGTLGATQLAKHVAVLEAFYKSDEGMQACDGGLDKLALLIKVAELNLKDAIAHLESAKPGPAEAESKPPETDVVLVVLREIAALTAAADMDVLLRFAEQRECLIGLPDQFIDALDEALQNLEFENAHSICAERIAMLSI